MMKSKILKLIKIFIYNIKNHSIFFAVKSFIHIHKGDNYCNNLTGKEKKYQLEESYFKNTDRIMNIDNPKTFNEKIQYLKYYDSTYLKSILADKYIMKYLISDLIGNKYIVKSYGAWKNFDDINFEDLPDSFVLKCNHGSGFNWIIKEKNKMDIDNLKLKVNRAINTNFGLNSNLELHYKDINRCIFAEEYIKEEFVDLQVWVANGKVLFLSYIEEPHGQNKKATYNCEWEKLDFVTSLPKLEKNIKKPEKLDEIISLSLKLAAPFKFVRVDWYLFKNNDFKISELTFTPAAGYVNWEPKEADNYFDSFRVN